jgi:hypothetical protein
MKQIKMKTVQFTIQLLHRPRIVLIVFGFLISGLMMCGRLSDEGDETITGLRSLGLDPELISAEDFLLGKAPLNFEARTGAPYKPGFNEEPSIPPQCWIETGYGTQNACKYCHTDYLSSIRHGNAFPIGYQQILYSFPSPGLNQILWQNIIHPQNIEKRLREEGIHIPDINDVDYVRKDNWRPAFALARSNGNDDWVNSDDIHSDWAFFPALNPDYLFPYSDGDPTSGGTHGYIDKEGFVKNQFDIYTGWRAINFFPYAIFTPLTGSVSGIYIRLPEAFFSVDGEIDIDIYKKNLSILERNIKNQGTEEKYFLGDASGVAVKKGFYPVGTEFAHPLHYVDLKADGKTGVNLAAVSSKGNYDYSFPGTRSKRVKEIRYMYKWKDVDLDDIAMDDHEEDGFGEYIGKEGQGWVDNEGGWILAAYIEDRNGNLRPQTTEELVQCIGCHGNVGNTVDAVWSFQRKLPGEHGWREMDYGAYDASNPGYSRLQDYLHENSGMGELGYFYYTVVGADLYGVMPDEVKTHILHYGRTNNLDNELGLLLPFELLFDDEQLKNLGQNERKAILLERQKVMRRFASDAAYLYKGADGEEYIRGALLYPSEQTMKNNIQLYRKIVLDQSFNLGKDVFGTEPEHIPFTFRSDGKVLDAKGMPIPIGAVITSRPYNEDGEGYTPTGLVSVNENGEPIDMNGQAVGVEYYRATGHVSKGGTFDMMYNPILSDRPFRPTR